MSDPTPSGPEDPADGGALVPVLDPETLREVFPDPAAARGRAAELRGEVRAPADDIDELRARGELVDVLRALDELDDALAEGRAAVDRAEMVGTAAQQHLARLRLAEVHTRRGEYADATLIATELLGVADQFGPVVEAFTHQLAGGNAYAQAHWADAAEHFARALALRERLELPEAQASQVALAAARRRADDEPDGADGGADDSSGPSGSTA